MIREAIGIKADVADFHCNLGHVERMRGEAAAAETAYREALRCGPGSAAAARALGVMLGEAGRLNEAVEVYHGALATQPNQPDIRFNLSAMLNRLGQVQDAEQALRRVIELRPDDVTAYASIAMLMLKCAKIDAAIEACRRGRAVEPNSGELHFGLGRALSRRGDYLEAADAFRTTLACDPGLGGAYSGLIRVLRLAGEPEAAVAAGREAAVAADAPSLVHAELGLALVALGRFDQALAAFEDGVAKDPRLRKTRRGSAEARPSHDSSASGRDAPLPVLFLARGGAFRGRKRTHLRRLRRDPEIRRRLSQVCPALDGLTPR